MKLSTAFLVMSCAVGVVSGAMAQDERRLAPAPTGSEPALTGGPSRQPDASYRLAPSDIVRILVFREEDLSTIARIDKNGTISFPLIGSVRLVGLTPQAAAKTIEQLLQKDYLVNPQVFVSLEEYSKRRFTMLGQVGRPGTYEMPSDTTLNLLEAIGMSGGFTRIAAPSRVIVKREVNGEEVVFKLDAKAMAKDDATKAFEILPGDTITVGESYF